jgi:hypothetical protein
VASVGFCCNLARRATIFSSEASLEGPWTAEVGRELRKGEELGYFAFGGSDSVEESCLKRIKDLRTFARPASRRHNRNEGRG